MGKRLDVPLSSGAASWPWIERHVMDTGKLPPRRAVRIEEMVNYFPIQNLRALSAEVLLLA